MHKSRPPAGALLYWAEEPALPAGSQITIWVKYMTKCFSHRWIYIYLHFNIGLLNHHHHHNNNNKLCIYLNNKVGS